MGPDHIITPKFLCVITPSSRNFRPYSSSFIHVFFLIRKLVRGLGLNFLNFLRHFGAKTFLMLSYHKFGQGARYGKCASPYCFVDAVPPKPLKIGDFWAWNRAF